MSSEPPAKRPKPPLPGGCAAVSKAVAGGAPVLAVALGGGSDVVGVLALARALGATRAILVQPRSPARGTEAPPTPQLTKVEAAAADAEHPGGAFYDNASMLSYLLRLAPDAPDGYYLTQPKDAAPPGADADAAKKGFSSASLASTTEAYAALLRDHGCAALVGLDFGGDVVLDLEPEGAPYISQRDGLNLLAAAAAAAEVEVPALFVAASPGVDAAAVAPEYDVRRAAALEEGAAEVPVLEMSAEGALEKIAGPAPECTLRALPAALLGARVPPAVEKAYLDGLCTLTERILGDAPAAKRAEHASKTYATVAAAVAPAAAGECFIIGQFRGGEKARCHLHSSFAVGLYAVVAD